MLTRLDFTRNSYVSSVFLCTMAFVLLNAPAFAVDITNDGAMMVLSMEEMESLAGGPSYPGPYHMSGKSACSTGWSCPSPQDTVYTDCNCTGPPRSKPCSTHYIGILWKEYSCKRNAFRRCTKNYPTGNSGGRRYKCS